MLSLPGCVPVPPVWDAWDELYQLGFIEPGVTTKDQELGRLGPPDSQSEGPGENYFIYRGQTFEQVYVTVLFQPMGGITYDWEVTIEFDENDVVIQASIAKRENLGSAYAELEAKAEDARLQAEAEYERLKAKADTGDPEAQFEVSSRAPNRAQAYRWLCLAAHQGHPRAQHKIGRFYQQGDPPAEEDLVRAYLWYKLAEKNGFQKEAVTYVRSNGAWKYQQFNNHGEWVRAFMTATQTSEAERLVAEWEPNPAECEQNDAPLGS